MDNDNVYIEGQKALGPKQNLRERMRLKDRHYPTLRLYYKTILISREKYLCKKRQIDQWEQNREPTNRLTYVFNWSVIWSKSNTIKIVFTANWC